MDRGKERSRWRRRGRRTDPSAPSASAPSTTSSATSPSPSSPDDRLRRRGRKGRRGALPSRHPRGNRRRTRVPPLHRRWGKETRSRRRKEMECGFPLPPFAPYKGAEWGRGRLAPPIEAEEGQATGADPLHRPAPARLPASAAATPSA